MNTDDQDMKQGVFKIRPQAVYTFIDDEAVIMTSFDSSLFGLNAVAAWILKCLEKQAMSAQAISDAVAQEFEVDSDQSMQDTCYFLKELLTQDLIQKVKASMASSRDACQMFNHSV